MGNLLSDANLISNRGVTPMQYSKIKEYLKTTYWDNCPWLLMMDYYGNVWDVPKEQFNNFYNPSTNDFGFDENKNYYNRGDDSTYRKFGGWNIDWKNGNDTSILKLTSCDLNNSQGYRVKHFDKTPSSSADGNYWSSDDKDRFDKYANFRIFPNQIGGLGNYDRPPNAIPGYYRVSRNNMGYTGSGEPSRQFTGAGFITINRGSAKYDPAFILFVILQDKERFANDIIENHPNVVKSILNEIYGITLIKDCLSSQSCYDKIINDTNDYRSKHADYISNLESKCTKMSYDSLGDCDYAIPQSDIITNKMIDYCVSNSSSNAVNDYCLDVLNSKPKANDIYLKKLCNIGDNAVTNINCKTLTPGDYTSPLVDDSKTYNKIIYDQVLNTWCDSTNFFKSGSSNWKNTEDPNDSDCLNNWNYIGGDGKLIANVNNLTSINDKSNWCATRTFLTKSPQNDDDNKLLKTLNQQCKFIKRKNALFDDDSNYNELNTYWKSLGCIPKLPVNIYLKISKKSLDEQKQFLKNYASTKNIYARNICFTGDALENGQPLLPGQCIYSMNKTYKLCLQKNGSLELIKNGEVINLVNNLAISLSDPNNHLLLMQNDGNLVHYAKDMPPLWASNTSGNDDKGIFLVMQEDGNPTLYDKNGNIIKKLTDRYVPPAPQITIKPNEQVQAVVATTPARANMNLVVDVGSSRSTPPISNSNDFVRSGFTDKEDDYTYLLYFLLFIIIIILTSIAIIRCKTTKTLSYLPRHEVK